MKKYLVPLVALLCLVSILIAGCGNSETSTTTSTTSAVPSTTVATSAPVSSSAAATSTTPAVTYATSAAAVTESPSENAPVYGGTLRFLYAYSIGTNIGWPLDDTNTQRMWGTNFVFAEPLVLYKVDGTVEPVLATDWKFADDFQSITFNLRQGVKFQDGTDFNADAVQWQINEIISESKGNAAYWKSAEALDDYTVRINFTQYTNTFWSDITNTNCFFVSPTQYREQGLEYVVEHPCGTGPFTLVSWARDQNMVFQRNDNYWQTGKPYLDGIEFITVKESMTAQASMRAGDADVLALQSGKGLDDMQKEGFNIYAYPAGTNALMPDTANADSKFADLRVRQAIDYAIDKQAIVDALGYGYMYVNNQLPGVLNPSWNPDIPASEYNPEKAKALLAEAGYPDGFKTNLYTFLDPGQPLAIQENLKAIGIEVEIQILDNLKFWQYNREGWKDGMMWCGYAFGPNFAASYKSFYPPYSPFANMSMAAPEGTAEKIEEVLSETDSIKHKALNQAFSKFLQDNMACICVVSDAMGYVINPSVMDGEWLRGNDYQYWNPATTWIKK